MSKFILLFFFIFLVSLAIATEVGEGDFMGIDIIIPEPVANFSIRNVNSSDYWDDLDVFNQTQMNNNAGTLNILESWLTSFGNTVWCALTGCTMTGDIDMNNNNINNIENATILDRIFLTGENHWIKRGSEELFGGISAQGFWMHHAEEHPKGTITFLVTANKTNSDIPAINLMAQSGRNNSAGVLGNSWQVVLNNITNNLTLYSDCFLLADKLGEELRVHCDSSDSGADFIVQDDIQAFGTVFADEGIRAESLASFIMNGNNFDIANGSLHIFSPTTFTSGFVLGDEVVKLHEVFSGGIGTFINLQEDLGDWFTTTSVFCDSGDCANSIGISQVGDIIMEVNISTTSVNDTYISFVYSLVNIKGSDSFIVTANNNVGSGEVTLLTDSTDDVVKSSQLISMPSSMWNQPKVSLRFECDVIKANRECYVDNIRVNGSAMSTTVIEVQGFNSEICFSDATRTGGVCNVGVFYNASVNTVFPQGNWNFSDVSVGGVDHSATTNLEWASAGHTFTSPGQTMNVESYNFLTTGNVTSNYFLGNGSFLTGIVDTNVSSICGDNEVMLGNDALALCINLNTTIDDRTGTGGNVFDQELNKTSNVTFANVTINDELCVGSCYDEDDFINFLKNQTLEVFNTYNTLWTSTYNLSYVSTFNATYDANIDTDTNASTTCSTSEVLLGNSSCMNSDVFFDDTIETDTSASVNCSTSEVFLGNGSCMNSDDFFDDTIIVDTNASTTCSTIQVLLGNSSCIDSDVFISTYNLSYESTYNLSYESTYNLSYESTYNATYDSNIDTDTNVSTACGDNEVMLGNDELALCINLNATIDDRVGTEGNVFDQELNKTSNVTFANVTVNDELCVGSCYDSDDFTNYLKNQTLETFNTYNAIWISTFNLSYESTYNLSYESTYNLSYVSTYNATYDANIDTDTNVSTACGNDEVMMGNDELALCLDLNVSIDVRATGLGDNESFNESYIDEKYSLTTMTNNSMVDSLHRHSELSASDGTPDKALLVSSAGDVGVEVTSTAPFTIKADGNTRLLRFIEDGGTEFYDMKMDSSGNLQFVNDAGVQTMMIKDFDGLVKIGAGTPGFTLDIESTFSSNAIDLMRLRTSHPATYLGITSYVDDGLHWANNPLAGASNGNTIFTTFNNRGQDHDHSDLNSDPTIILHSDTPPNTNNQEWGMMQFVGNGSGGGTWEFTTGSGDMVLNPAETVNVAQNATFDESINFAGGGYMYDNGTTLILGHT